MCEVDGNHRSESPFLAGPQGHHVAPWGRGSWIMPWALGLHISWPTGESQEQACAGVVWVGASPSPPSPCCTLMVVEGEGG